MRPLAVALLCALIGGGAYAKDAEECITAAGVVAPEDPCQAVVADDEVHEVVVGGAGQIRPRRGGPQQRQRHEPAVLAGIMQEGARRMHRKKQKAGGAVMAARRLLTELEI